MSARRSRWEPRIPGRYRWPLGLLVAATPIVVGVDFALGEPFDIQSVVERSMPVWAWATLLTFAGALSVAGFLARLPWVTIAGLHLSGVLFCALAVGAAYGHLDEQGGFRVPWAYLMIAAISWLMAVGYMDQLRRDRDR